jgi:bifunctional DNA-binding transcriptional regulator/antitoxin component of YhaV-PrlF toxin-antitoxin module
MPKRFLAVHDRGNLTLPADIRRRYGLDKPGVQVEVVAREGVIELRPHVAVPADQAWYWTRSWQQGERKVDEHVESGQVKVSRDIDELLADLDGVRAEER